MGVIYVISSSSNPFTVIPENVSVSDETIGRVAHILEFAVLAILTGNALLSGRKPTTIDAVKISVLSLTYAVFDEYHQTLVPERSFEFLDLGLDLIGILLGVGFVVYIFPLLGRK